MRACRALLVATALLCSKGLVSGAELLPYPRSPGDPPPQAAIAQIVDVRFEPFCARAGVDEFRWMVEVIADDVDSVSLLELPDVRVSNGAREPLLTRDGVPVTSVTLFDDGVLGDDIPGDGIFTVDGLGINPDVEFIGLFLSPSLQSTTFLLSFRDGHEEELVANPWVRPLVAQPSIPVPQVASPADDVQATRNTVGIVQALQGEFPSYAIDRKAAALRYYAYFADDRDFLLFAHPYAAAGQPAGNFAIVRNDIEGLGRPLFDSSDDWGSSSVLQGVISTYHGNLLGSFTLLNHELLHRFAVGLGLDLGMNHWDVVERDTSGFGGASGGVFNELEFIGQGTYRAHRYYSFSDYNDLELYLMGLLPIEDVATPIRTLVNPVFQAVEPVPGELLAKLYLADGIREVSTAEIVDVVGPRIPDHTQAQRSFRVARIVVLDRPLLPVEFACFDYDSHEYEKPLSAWGATFEDATGGRASMDTMVVPRSGEVPDGARVPGVPLRATSLPDGGGIELTWGASCLATDLDYTVYAGVLGSFDSHAPLTCSTSGATSWVVSDGGPSAYFLVAPTNGAAQGSLGHDGEDVERPSGEAACGRVRAARICQ